MSWSWATKLEPALLVHPGGSADSTWVAMKLTGYFSMEYTTIIQDMGGSPFLPRTNSALCPKSTYRNTGIAFTTAVCINKPSAEVPSAMTEVWELTTTPHKPY